MVIVNDLGARLGGLAFLVLEVADLMLVGSELLKVAVSVNFKKGKFFFESTLLAFVVFFDGKVLVE